MNKRQKLNIFVIIFAIIMISLFFLLKNCVLAMEKNKPYKSQTIEYDQNGQKNKIYLLTYKSLDGQYSHFLSDVKKHGSGYALVGFEQDVSFCNTNIIITPNKNEKAVCIVGPVGAHSENLQIVTYRSDQDQFSPVVFLRGSDSNDSIHSDEPAFFLRDYNSDGYIDLLDSNRDYEKNPLNDITIDYYKSTKEGFVFDKDENITYDEINK